MTGPDGEEVRAVGRPPGGAVFDSSGVEDIQAGSAGPPRRRRHPVRTSLIGLAATAVVTAGGIAASGALGGNGGKSPAAAASGPARTATVEKTTLNRSETVDGALGYGAASSVQASSGGDGQSAQNGGKDASGAEGGGSGGGTLTWLPSEGDVIERGEPVYRVDEDKVPLLYGSTPFYRTLDTGAEGEDVKLLENNLAALGYTGFTADDEYTSATADAVRAWQQDLGRKETGEVAPGDAVVASGAKRVAEVKAVLGSAASGEVLTWTGTERLVTVDLEAQYEDLVRPGTRATVKLPDNTQVAATVTKVGNAATAKPAESGGSSDEATLPVTLSVKDQKKLGRYQAAPVDVTLSAESRRNVLAVPVNALVARKGGGYAVQAVTAGAVEYRAVHLGRFANGMVEISGDGITEGLKVGIPQ